MKINLIWNVENK